MAYVDVEPILAQLGEATENLVLAGGQAQAFWVDQFAAAVPELRADIEEHGPFTSKDIDFVPHLWAAVEMCAKRLNGTIQQASIDHATPNPVVIHFTDTHGYKRDIDFLDRPYGVATSAEVFETSREVTFLDPALAATHRRFRVINPILSMECRLSNVVGLPKYRDAHGLRQARASILCAHEYVKRRLDQAGEREALNLNKRIFRFCKGDVGLQAATRYSLDPFAAVLRDERLPPEFHNKGYPQMQRELERLRDRGLDLER